MRPDAAALRAQAATYRRRADDHKRERRARMTIYLGLLDEMADLERQEVVLRNRADECELAAQSADAADRWERRASERMGRAAA